MNFAGSITRVKGVSDKRRLPRLAKIRLGFKLLKNGKEFPAESPFFLLPPEIARVYGGKVSVDRAKEMGVTRADVLKFVADNTHRLAEEIDIMLPLNDIAAVFPQSYKWYGSSRGVRCVGDGEKAMRYDDTAKAMVERTCPCEQLRTETNVRGECTLRAHLMCLVPKVSMGGIYQIDMGSYNSIIDINSGIDYVSALIGRFALVPLKLRRVPTQTHHDGRTQTHYTCQIIFDVSINELNVLRQDSQRIISHSAYMLPAPDDTNPAVDPELEVVYDPGTIDVAPEAPPCVTEQVELSETVIEEKSAVQIVLGKFDASESPDALKAAWESYQTDLASGRIVLSKEEQELLRIHKEKAKKRIAKLTKDHAPEPPKSEPAPEKPDLERIIDALRIATTYDEATSLYQAASSAYPWHKSEQIRIDISYSGRIAELEKEGR